MASTVNQPPMGANRIQQRTYGTRRLADRQFLALYLARRRRKRAASITTGSDTLTVDSTLVTVDSL